MLLLEEDGELFLVCRADGVQVHLEAKQLNPSSRKEIEIKSGSLTPKQRKVWEEFHGQMEKTQTTINRDEIEKKSA